LASDLTQSDLDIQPGELIAGKYRVERILGEGGMGVVVAAHHLHLDTKVAIKLLRPELLSNREAIARFAREAKAVAKLTTEHVARILDVGTLESGAPYMVMEYLEGGDLAAWLQQRGALPVEQAVEFVIQACVAVAEAHKAGIVHRDLKPANLFCIQRPDGQLSIKVLDFGISKLVEGAEAVEPRGPAVTKNFAVMGSPLYMSPEQMKSSRRADAQSDVWALGVILYELLSAQLPFDGESATDVAVKVASQPPRPLREVAPGVPPGLEAVILRCLEKDPALRHLNVAELALGLADFAPARSYASIERITGTIAASRISSSSVDARRSIPGSTTEHDLEASGAAPPVVPPETVGVLRPRATGELFGQTTSTSGTALSHRRAALIGVTVAGVVVLGGIAVVLTRLSGGTGSPPSAVAAAAGVTPSLPAPSAQTTAPPLPPSTASVAAPLPPSTASAASPPPPPPPSALPGTGPTAPAAPGVAISHSPSPPTAATVPPTAAVAVSHRASPPPPSCDPPFSLDAEGRKHFKPECFLKK